MTEQIKRAIETIENRDSIMDYCENRKLSDALDLAINSLKAWDEVLNELKGQADFANRCGDTEEELGIKGAIDIIKERLSEVEDGRY